MAKISFQLTRQRLEGSIKAEMSPGNGTTHPRKNILKIKTKAGKTLVLDIINMSRSKYFFLKLSYFNGFIKDRIIKYHNHK